MPRRPRRSAPQKLADDTVPSVAPGDTVRTRVAGAEEEDKPVEAPPLVIAAGHERSDATMEDPVAPLSAPEISVDGVRSRPDDTVLEVVAPPLGPEDSVPEAVPPTWGEVTRAADRVRWLESQLRRDAHPAMRAELLLELGEVYWQDLDEAALAERAYLEVLALEPGNAKAFEALDRIYVVSWQAEKRIELLINRTEHQSSPVEQAALLLRVAGLYQQLDQLEKAQITLETARGLDPANLAVVAQLEHLNRPAEPTESLDLVTLLEQQLASERDERSRVDLLERLASLHQQRGQPAEAKDRLEQILTIDPRRLSCYQRLEQQHLAGERWRELADVLERHARVASAEERARLCGQLAKLYEGPLGDVDRARQAYRALLRLAPNHAPSLQALLHLSEQAGDWPEASRLIEELIRHEPTAAVRAELLHRLARVQLEHPGSPQAVEDCLLRAVAEAPGHAGAVAKLAAIYRARSDYGKLVKLLLAAEEAAATPREKVDLLFQAGQVMLEQLGDEPRATQVLERVLAMDPDHARAAAPLSSIYWRLDRHEKNLPVLELLLRKTGPEDRERLIETHLRLAVSCDSLGRTERAERHYREVLAFDPGHSRALLGLGALSYAARRWSEALSCYGEAERAGKLAPPELGLALCRAGRCARELGRHAQAVELFERALQRAPGQTEAAEELATIQGQSQNWEAVLAVKRGLVGTAPEARRPELYRELAEICWRRLGRPTEAERELQQALALRPDDHALLHDLIELFSETGQWAKTIEVCQRMAELEPQPALRAKYHHTIAVICRDKLDDVDRAVDFFNRVLDEDPGQLQAFHAIDALCTTRRAWKQLDKAYRRMIQRLPKEGQVKLRAMLWHNLGEVLRTRRRNFADAATAFEVAVSLEPENLERLRILAELYRALGPSCLPKLVKLEHDLLRREPQVGDHYHALRKLYVEARQYDRAWCICMGLTLLKGADREEQAFFLKYRRRYFPRIKVSLTDELWRRSVWHSTQNPWLTALLGVAAPIVGAMTARPAAQFGLKPKHLRSAEQDELLLCLIFDYATAVLGVTKASLYLRPDRPEGLLLANTQGAPSAVAGARALRASSEKELAFLVGRELTFLRPEHYLRNVLPAVPQLQAVVLALLKLCQPKLPLAAAQTKALAPLIERLSAQLTASQREQLVRLVQKLCAEAPPNEATLASWRRALELTSDRVGFLLCDDLEVASRVISETAQGELSATERLAELVQYATSEAYLDLRVSLGLNLDAAEVRAR